MQQPQPRQALLPVMSSLIFSVYPGPNPELNRRQRATGGRG